VIALDTHVLARWLLADDAAQFAACQRLLAGDEDFTAPLTVMLELVWVLEARERQRGDIARALRALLGLPHFKPSQGPVLSQAVVWYEQGLDFADALHLAQSAGESRFASFDTRLIKRAARLRACRRWSNLCRPFASFYRRFLGLRARA
jgi:predicted nucleic-acid-binding protein